MSAMAAQLLFVGFILIVTTNVQSRTFDVDDQIKEFAINGLFPTPPRRLNFFSSVMVSLFYESMCPASKKLFTKHYSELVSKLDSYVDFYDIPFGKAKGTIDTLRNASLASLSVECQHGEAECYGNKLHICAAGIMSIITRSQKPAVDFKACLMELDKNNNGSTNKDVDECGSKLNFDKPTIKFIKTCATWNKNLVQAGLISSRFGGGYTSVPHLMINGRAWNRQPENLIKDVCAQFYYPPEPCRAYL